MRQLLLWSLMGLSMIAFVACDQAEYAPPEIIFIDDETHEHATIELEDVFYAKSNLENQMSSQLEQNPQSSNFSRGQQPTTSLKTNTQKPQIRIANAVYDFGFVDEGELVASSFRMHNDGPTTWKIEEVLPSCGCTNVKVTAMEVVSGAYIDVSFNLETKGRPGAQQKLIEIFSNAGYHRLLIKGVVYPPSYSQKETSSKTPSLQDSL